MHILLKFFRVYPWQSVLMLLALLLAGISEGISLSALLPLLSLALDQGEGDKVPGTDGGGQDGSGLEEIVRGVLHDVGLTPSIGVLLIIVMVGIVVKNLLLLAARKQIGYTAAQVTTDLRLSLLRAVLASRWEYFIRQPAGRMANAMTTEAMRASEAYIYGTTMIARCIEAVVYIIVALLISWQATLAALGAGLLVLVVTYALVRMSRRAGKRQTKLLKSLLGRLTDTLQSVKPLKAMGREDLADEVMAAETSKLNRALQKEVFSKAVLQAIQEPMFVGFIAIGIYVALVMWEVPASTMLMLALLLGRIMAQMGKIQRWYQKMVTAESAFWSIDQTTREAQETREISTGTLPPRFERDIRLQGVDFAYGEKVVLRDASAVIPKGSLVALTGPSGAGKTTIVDLITGLLQPQHGAILIDGVDLREMDLRQWRRKIGYVPQENLLLHDNVFHNVTLGDPGLDEADAEYALRAAGAWEFVSDLRDGMYSVVGERGASLSGGQRQRIMIARALAHRPELLILDEATSALDPKSEGAICDTLKQLAGRLTVLSISHQTALVDIADRVYRLQDERLIPVRSPAEH